MMTPAIVMVVLDLFDKHTPNNIVFFTLEWQSDLAQQRQASAAEDHAIVEEEAQYATWYARWLLQRGKIEQAQQVAQDHYERVKRVLGPSDINFLNLCNALTQTHLAAGSTAATKVPLYEDLIPSMRAIHGEAVTSILMPEFAAVLARAGRSDDAAATIRRYLAFRRAENMAPGVADNAKLDLALDQLIDWRDQYPELYDQLRAYRDTGVVAGQTAGEFADAELAEDFQKLQGQWEWKCREDGKVVEHMIFEAGGNKGLTRWIDADGNTLRGRGGTFQLRRSGACKVYTFTTGSEPQAKVAFIYSLQDNRFVIVSGLLTNRGSLPETRMMVWTRVAGQ